MIDILSRLGCYKKSTHQSWRMPCFLLLIVLFASAQSERCPKIENYPECTEVQIPCPADFGADGCPTKIVCEDKWFDIEKKSCTTTCWDIKCKKGEEKVENAIMWFEGGYGQCDRMQDFCVKFDSSVNFGIATTGVNPDPKTTIAWPNRCAPGKKWCNLGFDEYGYWKGSACKEDC